MNGPDPATKHPVNGFPRVCFIKNTVSNPAKAIKQRFASEIIDALLEIAWWDWSIEKISRNLGRIVSSDIDALRRAE